MHTAPASTRYQSIKACAAVLSPDVLFPASIL